MVRFRILAAAAVLTLQTATVMAQQPQAAAPALGLTAIPDADLDKYIAKSNAVVGLLNTSLRGSESWQRYTSWADVKRGPTGKERIIYGLYSIGASAKDSIAKGRAAAAAEPAIPALDDATRDLASTFEALLPIFNEAEAYYNRKDYLTDGMAGGKALHARIVPAAIAFVDARARANALQDQFKDLIDREQLAKIEKVEGKSVRWHMRNTMMLTKKIVDLMPDNPRRADLKAFDAALAAYGDAVRDFDNAVRESGKSNSIDSYPRDILGKLREMRDNIAKGRAADGMTFSFDYNAVITRYNNMVTMSNAFR